MREARKFLLGLVVSVAFGVLGATFASAQVTFLISSHDLAHTTEVSNRIVLLDKGELVKDIITTPETLQELEDFFATSVESEITV